MGIEIRRAIGHWLPLSKGWVAGVLGEIADSGDGQLKPDHRVEMFSVKDAMPYNNGYNGDMNALMVCDCSPDRSRRSPKFLG
jgi:hypothetical protein